jgi:hypothetical protein
MRCGNDPRSHATAWDRAVVAEFRAYLERRAQGREAGQGLHAWEQAGEHRYRCPTCGVRATHHGPDRNMREPWVEFTMPSGWTWWSADDAPPPCPPPPVEAECPWEEPRAARYAGAKGDDQLDTAMRTWCERHECAVSECPEPGPYCPGARAHEDGDGSGCTGREDSCRCGCPACCGDTPDMWGAPDH